MTDFKMVAIAEIKADPHQPRKFFDEAALKELTESIKEKGVLQPILIRPNGKGYVLVCGERRFRASTGAGLKEIPAVIRELNDEEALQLQIIENLQRKDVHPLEEAIAFKSLMENKTKPLTAEEVAAKVGKQVYYIRQRAKLSSLIKEWQQVFYKNKMYVTGALAVCQLDEKTQLEFYKNRVSPKNLDIPHYMVSISQDDLDRLQSKLNKAPFKKDDATLVPEAGACTTCPFNTAVSSLFPEDAKNPTCNNPTCYSAKCNAVFNRNVKAAIEDPAVVFVDGTYYADEDERKVIDAVKKQGVKVYCRNDNEYSEVSTSDKSFKTGLKTGRVLKAFALCGHNAGSYIYITLEKKKTETTSAQVKEKISEGNATAEDINLEIARVKEREKRSEELDNIKIHTAIVDAMHVPSPGASNPRLGSYIKELDKPGFELQPIDRGIMLYMILDKSGLIHDTIKGVPDFPGGKQYAFDYFKELSQVSDATIAHVIRMAALDNYKSRNLQYGLSTEDTALYLIAEYIGVDVKGLEKAQAEKAAKRKNNVTARIESLNKQKRELTKEVKPAAAKKPAVKKAAPKKAAKKAAKK